jgi:2-hydroxychromene-2-carboxylate isomerase
MHPAAVLKALERRSVADALARTTAEAVARGVSDVPAIWSTTAVFTGVAGLDDAAALLA